MEYKGNQVIIARDEYAALIASIKELQAEVKRLQERVTELEQENKELKIRLNINSSNSHKPPSSDAYKKTVKNNREQSSRKQGAQQGHKGKTLELVANPDKVILHRLKGHCKCGKELAGMGGKKIQLKQVFDLPEKLLEVTEHQIEVVACSCGRVHQAECDIKSVTQYGGKIKALAVYMNQYQLLPYERLQEFMEHCFGISMSDGVLEKSNEQCYTHLESTEQKIKQGLITSAVIHNDETGIRCTGKTQWIHSTSTDAYTHYSIHAKRGKEAMDAIGILEMFKGISVHDRWMAYDRYDCLHALCNAHLLRDLKFLQEELKCTWAGKMIALLVQANAYKTSVFGFNKKKRELIEIGYNQIIRQARKEEARNATLPRVLGAKKPTRGRIAKPKTLNLLEVFIDRREQILRFIHNKDVPFDNNLAERDLRMVKLKQKISGCFRTLHGGEIFCRIRGYISTVRKQGHNVLDAIEQAITGNPIVCYQPT